MIPQKHLAQDEKTMETHKNQGSKSDEIKTVSNEVLKRLIEEVKFENQNNILAYNRTHNRHNRGR